MPVPPSHRLPDGFTVRLDPRAQRRDGGAALLGGSPLRMLRLAPAARPLLAGDRLVVTDARTATLAGRLLDAGLAHPDGPQAGAVAVTVVVPVKDRTAGLARLLGALRADPGTAGCPVVVVDDGSADPTAVAAVVAEFGAGLVRHEEARGPAAARNAGLRAVRTPAVAFLDSDCVPSTGWLPRLAGHLADPRLALVAPRIAGVPVDRPGWVSRYEEVASALDMGPHPAAVTPRSAVSYVPSAALVGRCSALGAGFDESMQVAEDVDLVWRLVGAGWRVRYEPAAEVAHEHRGEPGEWLGRRAFYGTGAALLAARHGSAVAPIVISPWSAAAWALALTGRPAGLAAAVGVLGVATARLARRLGRPGQPPPAGLSAGLVLRGTAASGRTLARAGTRHHWPLTVGACLVSRRARRLTAAVAVLDALLGWWPQRRAIGLLAFTAGRRLEDLGYGAGLWSGALRARDVRALLPAGPGKI
ncbi:mycofactocin biosynthesis glycosyltransferase MftF [Modestobacter lapidis]